METEEIDSSSFLDDESLLTDRPEGSSEQAAGLADQFSFKQIGSMAKYIEPISGNTTLDELVEMFQQQENLTAVPVEEYDRVIGVIDRKTVMSQTSTAWKRFTAKNVSDYVQRSSAVLYARDFIEKTLAKVSEINREDGVIYFPVFNNRSFYGIVSLDDFLARIAEIREQDLQKAAVIQQGLLPTEEELSTLPFKVTCWNRMANALGGDYFKTFELDKDKYLLCCFDVSGKNVAASLLTIAVGSFFSAMKHMDSLPKNPAKLIARLDAYLKDTVPVGSFITAAICYVDYERKQLYLFNMGHTTVYLLFEEGPKTRLASVNPQLPPLGMGAVKEALEAAADTEEKPFTAIPIKTNMHLEMYSDGFTDMQSDDGVRYDEERSKRFFVDLYTTATADVQGRITHVVDNWIQNAMLPDDITVMDVRFGR